MTDRPLVHLAEGADQDDRSSLLAAFRSVQDSHRRREISDLHVRELLTYVHYHDRRGDGVQMSYDDVAKVLSCERSTARSVVRRAEEVYGLLATFESRYTRGGQAPNRYSIDWAAVRAINHPTSCPEPTSDAVQSAPPPHEPGVSGVHPPATRVQGDVARVQPPAAGVHPYKEDTLSSPLCLTAAAAEAAAVWKGWDEERIAEVKRRATALFKRLSRRRDPPSRDFVWQVAIAGELLDRGMAADWTSRLAAGGIAHPRRWLEAAIRKECEARQLNWHELRRHLPPAPAPQPTEG